jgi:hypothetical protein
VLGWCYNFDYYKTYTYFAATKVVACEGRTEYSWWEGDIGFGSDTIYNIRKCYDTERSRSGSCQVNIGVNRSAFTPNSEPFVSRIESHVDELRADVGEEGSIDFTSESVFCKTGRWPYKRVFHEQVITASVAVNAVKVQWYVNATPIIDNSGMLLISAFCKSPFPLPNGRSSNKVTTVKYEIVTGQRESTLKLFNDPLDGSYSLSIGMVATGYASQYTSAMFHGETCDFEQEQLEGYARCLRQKLIDKIANRIPISVANVHGPRIVIPWPQEIWRFVPEGRLEAIDYLRELAIYSFRDDPETFIKAINQIEVETGLAGVMRFIKTTPAKSCCNDCSNREGALP